MLSQWLLQLFSRGKKDEIRSLPQITIKKTFNYYKSFTAPTPDINATLYNEQGIEVGYATYALSPLQDRIYVFGIKVKHEFRRQGYGMALLSYLATTYSQPIVPIHELYSANKFWSAARQLKLLNLQVASPLSASEMDHERNRWQHLQPEIARLEHIIHERLSVQLEPWEVAISRGLENVSAP